AIDTAKKLVTGLKDKIGLQTGGVTRGAALVGEGSKRFPEFVIPTDPAYRNTAKALYGRLGRTLGVESGMDPATTRAILKSARAWSTGATAGVPVGGAGGILLNANRRANAATAQQSTTAKANGGSETTVNINGNLVLPNITNKTGAETLIKNLEALAR
ncbi:MAG TPA: hypothetical protein VGP24_08785, partial [Glaciihabitans sp.]|nr:hypothetical protein [Glaciihabitans sp.]